MYERFLDERLRKVINIITEQCGFREIFGSHTLIKRLQILQDYCTYIGQNLHLACIDIQEAFEMETRDPIQTVGSRDTR